jgi:hypothetical protein
MNLDRHNLDLIIRSTFADEEAGDVYQNGLCRSFAIGLSDFVRTVDPALGVVLMIGEHEGMFDHGVLHIHRMGESFDWRGAGAQERWTEHRGGAVDWRSSYDLLCRITWGDLDDGWRSQAQKVQESLMVTAKTMGITAPPAREIPHLPRTSGLLGEMRDAGVPQRTI